MLITILVALFIAMFVGVLIASEGNEVYSAPAFFAVGLGLRAMAAGTGLLFFLVIGTALATCDVPVTVLAGVSLPVILLGTWAARMSLEDLWRDTVERAVCSAKVRAARPVDPMRQLTRVAR